MWSIEITATVYSFGQNGNEPKESTLIGVLIQVIWLTEKSQKPHH